MNNLQWKIRCAVQRLHKRYYNHPLIFITEADVQCALYAELLASSSRVKRTIVRDSVGRRIDNWEYPVFTGPLHAELSSTKRKTTEFVDLCLIDPSIFAFWIKKTKFSIENQRIPVWGWDVDWPESAIGIEIKFNQFIVNDGKRWKAFRRSLATDLKKLRRYKRGWLVFVDQHSLIKNRQKWREFMDGVIHDSGYLKKSLNAYYLSPNLGKALCYKPSSSSFW